MTHPTFDTTGWKQRLREARLRITVTRLGVLKVLHDSPIPMSAQEVFDHIRRQGGDRVTVYRTLNSLADVGFLHRMDPGDRVWRYGILQRDHHHHAHFVCDDCGEVRCLTDAVVSIDFKEKPVRGSKSSSTSGTGGTVRPEPRLNIRQQDVYLHGVCEKCDAVPARGRVSQSPDAKRSRRGTPRRVVGMPRDHA